MRSFLQKLFTYGKPAQKNLYIAFLGFILYNLFNVFSLALLIPFLEILFTQEALYTPMPHGWDLHEWKNYFFWWLYQFRTEKGPFVALGLFSLIIAGAILLKNLFRYLSAYFMIGYENTLVQAIRNHIFSHLTQKPLAYFIHQRKGKILNLLTSDTQIIQEAIVGTLYNLINDPLTMLFFLTSMFLLSWKLTLVSLLILPLTGLLLSKISRTLRRRSQKGQTRLDHLTTMAEEFISGIRVVKAHAAEEFENERFQNLNRSYTKTLTLLRRRMELVSPLTEVISIIVVLGLLYYGMGLVLSKELKPSEFITFIALFAQFLSPLKTFSNAIARIQKAIASHNRIETFLREHHTSYTPTPHYSIQKIQKEIRLVNVSFRYENQVILQNINLTIPIGKWVAFVGPSGSGKTTLLDLICGFYQPTEGEIYIDDVPLSHIDKKSYYNLFGIVTQDGMLFNTSLAANIAYAASKVEEHQLIQAAQKADALDFIQRLPQQWATIVGERGTRFSGGQRQRIALARALYRSPQILLLDEATSALDTESETRIQKALEEIAHQKTVIVIAHRLSTVRKADKIYVIDQGKIMDEGTHNELLARQGLYQQLYRLQYT
ncbi:MAG: ABC transporter ATP-binding protein [Bacteroidia bacterium]